MKAHLGGRSLLFLGDMDPVDLLIFAWLRFRLRSDKVRYVGVGGRLLSQLSLFDEASIQIPQAPSELEAHSLLLDALPDLDDITGASVVRLLISGLKIEVEGALFGRGASRARFLTAVRNSI